MLTLYMLHILTVITCKLPSQKKKPLLPHNTILNMLRFLDVENMDVTSTCLILL